MAPKDASFGEPQVNLEITGTPGEYTVNVTADKFVRALRMAVDGNDGHMFSDNYFDLLPGERKTVEVYRCSVQPEVKQVR